MPGDVVVIGNVATATLFVSNGKRLNASWFSVRLENLYPLFGSSEIGRLHSVAERFRGLKRYRNGSAETTECHRMLGSVPSEFNLDHRSRLLRVVATILSSEFASIHELKKDLLPLDSHFSNVVEGLSIDELQSLGVDELAARFCCSRRHLNRLFHKHFGISVSDLRREARLMKAYCLLRHPESKIMSIAEECGYNHPGLFNASFKRRFGTSPGRLRKMWARTEADSDSDGKPANPEVSTSDGQSANPLGIEWVPGAKGSRNHRNGYANGSKNSIGIVNAKLSSSRSSRAAIEWLGLRAKELLPSPKAKPVSKRLRASQS